MLKTGVDTTMIKENLIGDSHLLKVNEIAKIAEVSRNVVWHYIKKHKIKPAKSDTKPFLFSANLVSKIVSEHGQTHNGTQKQTQKQKHIETGKLNDTNVSADLLKMFQTQLETLNKQIEFKDKQLEQQRHDIEYFQKQLIDSRLELKNNQRLLDSVQNHKDTNAEENAQLKSDLEQAKKQIEQLKKDAESASELSSKVEKINKASLWQRITKKFD